MASIPSVRAAIVAGLAADRRLDGSNGAKVNVFDHGGDFTLEDLDRYSADSPALVLACLRWRGARESGASVAHVTWGLVCIVRDRPGLASTEATDLDGARSAAVLALADRATRALLGKFYGDAASPAVSAPKELDAINQYSPDLDRKGIAMFGLVWTQMIELQDVDVDALDDWVSAHVDYETYTRPEETLGEVPEAQDIIDGLDA